VLIGVNRHIKLIQIRISKWSKIAQEKIMIARRLIKQ
jgi:hypothetical protein